MKFLSYEDLQERGIRLSRVQLKRNIELGLFPKPVRLGPNTIAWPEDAIEAWIERICNEETAIPPRPRRRADTAASEPTDTAPPPLAAAAPK